MKLRPGAVQIFVSDIEKAKEWYPRVLGMKILREFPNFKCVLMKLGTREFDVGVPNPAWGEGWKKVKIGGRTPIFFETFHIFKTVQELKKQGAKIIEKPYKRPWGELKAVFADPDGNEFNLIQNN